MKGIIVVLIALISISFSMCIQPIVSNDEDLNKLYLFLEEDKTDENKYTENYTCSHFTREHSIELYRKIQYTMLGYNTKRYRHLGSRRMNGF